MKWFSILMLVILLIIGVKYYTINQQEIEETFPAIVPSNEHIEDDNQENVMLDENKLNEDTQDKGTNNEPKKEAEKESKAEEVVANSLQEFAATHIVFLGDSITKGTGDATKEGYAIDIVNYITEDIEEDVSYKNFGIKGYRSEQLVEKIEKEDVITNLQQAEYVFITIGGNDILKIVEHNFFSLNIDLFAEGKKDFLRNLFIIVQSIRSINPSANIYLIGLFNPFHNFFADIEEIDQVILEWNNAIQDVTEINERTKYIPIYDIFLNSDDELFADDMLHPNEQGYERIADRIRIYLGLYEGNEEAEIE